MNKNIILTTLFFGAIWGILEATLGYVLQFLPPLISGSVMFPIGATILIYVYLTTKSKKSVLYVGLIAAMIKSVNFFMPGLLPIKTYNPMIAIMLQSLVMVGVCYVIDKRKVTLNVLSIASASILWRMMFFVNISINHALTGFIFPQLKSSAASFEFIFTLGILGSIMAVIFYFGLIAFRNLFKFEYKPRLSISLVTLILAITLTFYIQMIG